MSDPKYIRQRREAGVRYWFGKVEMISLLMEGVVLLESVGGIFVHGTEKMKPEPEMLMEAVIFRS